MVLAACGAAGAVAIGYYLFAGKNDKDDEVDVGNTRGGGPNNRQGSSQRVLLAREHSGLDIEKIAAACKASGQNWKDPDFGHDGFPGDSIGDLELKDASAASLW